MPKELILYCDESSEKGTYFSNFYGGMIVSSNHLREVQERLAASKRSNGFFGEVKWNKVTDQYLCKYISFVDETFNLLSEGKIKARIMFTHNVNVAIGLTSDHVENKYFILYYQFIKHAFGLAYANNTAERIRCRLYMDKMPDTDQKIKQFKQYVSNLGSSLDFRESKIYFPLDQIAEVVSHEHDVLQSIDVILGAMNFRLNNYHLVKPEGSSKRGRRTIAKEKLYRHILLRIRELYPNFNIGTSTGTANGPADRWHHPYRHWKFIPKVHRIDDTKVKGYRKGSRCG